MSDKTAKYEYRNDSAFGDGVRDAARVVAYEIFELGNIDIIDYILSHVALPEVVADEWRGFLDEYEENDFVTDENGIPYHAEAKNAIAKVRALLDEVSRVAKAEIRFVLWLAGEQAVRTRYDGNDENMSAYDVSGGVVLSDLGFDGRLYGFAELPEPATLPVTA